MDVVEIEGDPVDDVNNNINNNNYSEVDVEQHTTSSPINGEDQSTQQDMFNTSGTSDQLSLPQTDPFPEKVVISSEISRESLSTAAQQIIDDLNAKRKQDTQMLINIKKALENQTEKIYKTTEQHLFEVYDKQGRIVQDKLQLLFSIIDNISKLETELKEFKQALQILYQDMKD